MPNPHPQIHPIVCGRTKPPPPTADATFIAIQTDTQDRFLCKDNKKVAWLPLVEMLAQRLARRCGLVVPDCHVIELTTAPGEYLFGSKWEGGAEDWKPGLVSKATNPLEFSKVYAFDLLVHNIDRHLNNYLYLQLAGETVVKAMDHSRTFWFSGWPLPAPPPHAATNTMRAFVQWSAEVQWDKPAAVQVVLRWKGILPAEAAEMIDVMPAAWLDQTQRDAFVNWWGGTEWSDRADAILGMLP